MKQIACKILKFQILTALSGFLYSVFYRLCCQTLRFTPAQTFLTPLGQAANKISSSQVLQLKLSHSWCYTLLIFSFTLGSCKAGFPVFTDNAGVTSQMSTEDKEVSQADDFASTDPRSLKNVVLGADNNYFQLNTDAFKSLTELDNQQMQGAVPALNLNWGEFLKAYWKFEPSKHALPDTRGFHNGTLLNLEPGNYFYSAGVVNSSLNFIGSDLGAHVEVPEHADFQLGDRAFTIMGWVFLDAGHSFTQQGIMGTIDPTDISNRGWGIRIARSSQKMKFWTNEETFIGNSNIKEKQWTHFAITRKSNKLTFFLNGTVDANFDIQEFNNLAAPLTIGKYASRKLYGALDDLSLWHKQLDAATITAVYESQFLRVGTYTSPIFNLSALADPSKLFTTSQFPTQKQLPDFGLTETMYPKGNISMAHNIALFHLNEVTVGNGTLVTFSDSSTKNNESPLEFVASQVTGILMGACSTSCPTSAPGLFQRALHFERNQKQRITFQHQTKIEIEQGTISFWFRSTYLKGTSAPNFFSLLGFSNAQTLLAKGAIGNAATSGHLSIHLWGDGQIEAQLHSPLLTLNTVKSTARALLNRWHHVVLSFGSEGLKLYFDGVLADSTPYRGGLIDGNRGLTFKNTAPMLMGASTITTANLDTQSLTAFLQGDLDEFAIWNTQLDLQTIEYIYLRGSQKLAIQIRTCSTKTCSSSDLFKGPRGPFTSYSEANNTSLAPKGIPLKSLLNGKKYLQYRALFQSNFFYNAPLGPSNLQHSPILQDAYIQ